MPDSEFPTVTYEAWLENLTAGSAGERRLQRLRDELVEGITTLPLYPPADDPPPSDPWAHPVEADGWLAAERFAGRGAEGVAGAIRRGVQGGTRAAEVDLEALDRCRPTDLRLLWQAVDHPAVELELRTGRHFLPVSLALERIRDAAEDLPDIRIDLAADPGTLLLGHACGSGSDRLHDEIEGAFAILEEPRLRVLRVSSVLVHEAGGHAAQEIAWLLAAALHSLRALENRGRPPDAVLAATSFELPLGADLFLEISKIRAFRRLWRLCLEECSLPPLRPRLHGISSRRARSPRDPAADLLRLGGAGFAGALAGVDRLTLLPPDLHGRERSERDARVARNLHHLLREESGLHRVDDPLAGSDAIESLTDALAAAAWETFREIERRGLVESIASGWLRDRVQETRRARERRLVEGRDLFVGLNLFPDPEQPPAGASGPPPPSPSGEPSEEEARAWGELDLSALADAVARDADLRRFVTPGGPGGGALRPAPLAEPLERFRRAADAAALRTGERASVFVARLGASSGAQEPPLLRLIPAVGLRRIEASEGLVGDRLASELASASTAVAVLWRTPEFSEGDLSTHGPSLRNAGALLVADAGAPELQRADGLISFLEGSFPLLGIDPEVPA